MRNKIIEKAIIETIDKSEYNREFKDSFKKYIINKFESNAAESDLKVVLELLDVDKED